nr:hypothetical protein [Cochlodiniinecator piscidefendens]
MPIDAVFLNPFEDRHAGELSAVVDTIAFGMPRSAMTRFSSRATRWPDSDVSAI